MLLTRPIENLLLEDYLALEAEMVKTIAEPTLFTWVVAPTVIYGRHQLREQEVNEAYCASRMRVRRSRQPHGLFRLPLDPLAGGL